LRCSAAPKSLYAMRTALNLLNTAHSAPAVREVIEHGRRADCHHQQDQRDFRVTSPPKRPPGHQRQRDGQHQHELLGTNQETAVGQQASCAQCKAPAGSLLVESVPAHHGRHHQQAGIGRILRNQDCPCDDQRQCRDRGCNPDASREHAADDHSADHDDDSQSDQRVTRHAPDLRNQSDEVPPQDVRIDQSGRSARGDAIPVGDHRQMDVVIGLEDRRGNRAQQKDEANRDWPRDPCRWFTVDEAVETNVFFSGDRSPNA
jgi:hypothetical protein